MKKTLFGALIMLLVFAATGSAVTGYYHVNVHCQDGSTNLSGVKVTLYGGLETHDSVASLFIHERLATGYYQGNTNSSGVCTLNIPQAMQGPEGTMAGTVPIPMTFSVKAASGRKIKWSNTYGLNAGTQTKDINFNFMEPAKIIKAPSFIQKSKLPPLVR